MNDQGVSDRYAQLQDFLSSVSFVLSLFFSHLPSLLINMSACHPPICRVFWPGISLCSLSLSCFLSLSEGTTEGITLTTLAKDNKSTLPSDLKLNCLVVSMLHTFLMLEKQRVHKSSQLGQEEAARHFRLSRLGGIFVSSIFILHFMFSYCANKLYQSVLIS